MVQLWEIDVISHISHRLKCHKRRIDCSETGKRRKGEPEILKYPTSFYNETDFAMRGIISE